MRARAGAAPEEMMAAASELSPALAESAQGEPVSFEEIGSVELKGVTGALDLYRAARAE